MTCTSCSQLRKHMRQRKMRRELLARRICHSPLFPLPKDPTMASPGRLILAVKKATGTTQFREDSSADGIDALLVQDCLRNERSELIPTHRRPHLRQTITGTQHQQVQSAHPMTSLAPGGSHGGKRWRGQYSLPVKRVPTSPHIIPSHQVHDFASLSISVASLYGLKSSPRS